MRQLNKPLCVRRASIIELLPISLPLLLACGLAPTALGQWTVTNLHPADEVVGTPPAATAYTYTDSKALAVRNGRQVGIASYTSSSTLDPAGRQGKKWSGSAASALSLPYPPNDTDGVQQVAGETTSTNNCFPLGCSYNRALLFGDNTPVTVLGEGSSYFTASGVDGAQQVGLANGYFAALWTGTAASLVSLHPSVPNISRSYAIDVRDGHQVGYVQFLSTFRACRWTGTAASYVDLHPPTAAQSRAYRVDNGVQVGDVILTGASQQAALWRGTPESYVNLNPAGSLQSYARGVSGGVQAGSAYIDRWGATIWRGTAASAQNLHTFLPASFTRSFAEDIDVQGSEITVVGYGFNATNSRDEALMWKATVAAIAQPPASVIACPGGSAVFNIAVTPGSSAVSYRWRKNNSNLSDDARIAGSGTPTLTISGVSAADVGSYDCLVADALSAVDSVNANLSLAQATASRAPGGRICPGASVTLSLNASLPPGAVTYQWRRNATALNVGSNPSAGSAVLSLSSVATADAGSYDCLVTTSCGVIDSSDVALTVGNIEQPPSNQSGCAGGTATFSVILDQDRPGKQWLKNGNPISGNPTASTTSLVLSNLSGADAASYSFRYNANNCGTVTTNGAVLTVTTGAPTLSQQPAAVQTCDGGTASFAVVATGVATFSWRKGTVPISTTTNPSAATATLTIASVLPGDTGSYDCIITNTCGSTSSAPATLTLGPCGCSLADVAGGGGNGLSPDGIVDGSDFIAFINSFSSGDVAIDLLADVAGGGPNGDEADGIIDGSDFIAFINSFSAGC